jgi:hypothetical protein
VAPGEQRQRASRRMGASAGEPPFVRTAQLQLVVQPAELVRQCRCDGSRAAATGPRDGRPLPDGKGLAAGVGGLPALPRASNPGRAVKHARKHHSTCSNALTACELSHAPGRRPYWTRPQVKERQCRLRQLPVLPLARPPPPSTRCPALVSLLLSTLLWSATADGAWPLRLTIQHMARATPL